MLVVGAIGMMGVVELGAWSGGDSSPLGKVSLVGSSPTKCILIMSFD